LKIPVTSDANDANVTFELQKGDQNQCEPIVILSIEEDLVAQQERSSL
jgi:hypothetical protein